MLWLNRNNRVQNSHLSSIMLLELRMTTYIALGNIGVFMLFCFPLCYGLEPEVGFRLRYLTCS